MLKYLSFSPSRSIESTIHSQNLLSLRGFPVFLSIHQYPGTFRRRPIISSLWSTCGGISSARSSNETESSVANHSSCTSSHVIPGTSLSSFSSFHFRTLSRHLSSIIRHIVSINVSRRTLLNKYKSSNLRIADNPSGLGSFTNLSHTCM